MSGEDFESHYQLYEQSFMRKAHEEFDQQSSNNKVQYLRGVYRYLLLNRLLARKEHTIGTVIKDRYHEKLRSSEQMGNIISRYLAKIIQNIGPDMFEQMRTDAVRTLYHVFPDKTKKGGQYISSAVDGLDIEKHKKFGLRQIRKNTVLDYAKENDIPVRDSRAAQRVLAPRMSKIKREQAKRRIK